MALTMQNILKEFNEQIVNTENQINFQIKRLEAERAEYLRMEDNRRQQIESLKNDLMVTGMMKAELKSRFSY